MSLLVHYLYNKHILVHPSSYNNIFISLHLYVYLIHISIYSKKFKWDKDLKTVPITGITSLNCVD